MAEPIQGFTRHPRDRVQADSAISSFKPAKRDIALALLSLFALCSLCYAVATGPGIGKDLLYYQAIGRSWASGTYLPDTGMFYGPAPWTVVAFSLMSPLGPSQAVTLMLALNLAAAGMTLYLAMKLWGRDWGSREKIFLCSLLLAWAPFRIAVRNGQLSLIVTALVLGFIWTRRQKREYAAGALLGLSLIKYPLSFPFLLYTIWRKEWRTAGIALSIPLILTLTYAIRLEISPVRIGLDYARDIAGNLATKQSIFGGVTEIKPLIDYFLGDERWLAMPATLALWLLALAGLGIAFNRAKTWEDGHFAALSLFSLWVVFHRPYDSVLLIIPAAVLIELRREPRARRFADIGLTLLGLFVLSVPGLLTDRLKLDSAALARNPFGFMGLHLERLAVIGLFGSILVLMLKRGSSARARRAAYSSD